jgi:hypothetical protein
MIKAISPALLLVCAMSLGCPDVPISAVDTFHVDAVTDGGDVFVPLEVHRILESIGEPEGGERISLYGAGFQQGAKVFFGKDAGDGVLVLDGTQLNCNVPAHAPGLVDVTVVLPDGQEVTFERGYLYRGPLLIESITPTEAVSRQDTSVTVKGDFFDKTTRILLGGRLLREQKLIDEQTIEGFVPARLQGRSGQVEVIASNGFEQRMLSEGFRYLDDLHVAWITPPNGDSKGGGVITIYGGGLTPESVITVGGKQTEVLIEGNGNTMTVRVPPLAVGSWDLEVTNGTEIKVLPEAFVSHDVESPPSQLALLGAWPAMGRSQGGSSLALTVTGLPWSGAAQGLTVEVNGSIAPIIEVNSLESLIVIEAPPGSGGPANIEVKRLDQTSSRDDLFRYEIALTIDKIIPATSSLKPDGLVVIEGQGFADGMQVLIGNRPAEVQSVNAEGTKVNVLAPSSVPGFEDVQIRLDHKHTIANAGFHYLHAGASRVLAVAPPEGSQAGGRLIRLYGEGLASFQGPLHVGPTRIDDTTIQDDATLLFHAPAGEVSDLSIDAASAGLLAMVYRLFDPTSRYGGTNGGPIPEALNVTILEMAERKPIKDAFVILWDDLGTPYQGLTDERGQITFSDEGFGPPQMVTAGKDMHTTASVVDFDARNVTLFLYSFEPSPPGEGNPPPVEPIPNSAISGEVTGLDKYIVLPPGQCDGIADELPGTLCQACTTDADCEGEQSRCLDLGEQGKRCTVACSTDADCPKDFVCTGMGFGAVQCVPRPGERTAFCASTQASIFNYELPGQFPQDEEAAEPVPNAINGPKGVFTGADSVYTLTTKPGEQAIVCFGGYLDTNEVTGASTFVPLRMGVRRHVFAEPGSPIDAQDIRLDIPLDRTLRVRLDNAPTEEGEANHHGVDIFLDFGADGVFRMPQRGFAIGENEFEFDHFPTKFEDSLYDVTYSVYSRAFPLKTSLMTSNDGTYVRMRDIEAVNRDSVFEILGKDAFQTQYGIDADIHGIHGVGDRLWAAGSEGQILVFDGTWWGLKQTPIKETLRAVWARTEEDIIAVGDHGSILHSNGLVWTVAEPPEALAKAHWWDVHGVGSNWWLAGDQGLWSYDGENFTLLLSDEDGRPQRVRGLWSGAADSVWIVGEGGLIRHWTPSGFESFDMPGGDLLAISGVSNSDFWVVGEKGRILHWDGESFFEYVPLAKQTLRDVTAIDSQDVWAAGDSGLLLHWDGQAWSIHTQVEHIDLHAVGVTNKGKRMVGGLPVLIVGPFLPIPKPVNPNALGLFMGSPISWKVGEGATPTMTLVGLADANSFPFWWLFVDGKRRHVPLPDLATAWGLMPIWPGDGVLRLNSFYIPEGSINEFDYGTLGQGAWRSWTITDVPVSWW